MQCRVGPGEGDGAAIGTVLKRDVFGDIGLAAKTASDVAMDTADAFASAHGASGDLQITHMARLLDTST